MNTVKWTPEKVRPILNSWCNGATAGQIGKQTGNERWSINYILDRVTTANNLGARSELREYSPDVLLRRFEIYREEAEERALSGGKDNLGREPGFMSDGDREAANEAFLNLLEKHHGNGMRAAG